MPATLYVQLSSTQRTQLQALRQDPTLKPRERDRVEMFLLSATGMKVPQLAQHLGRCEATLRCGIRQFETEGVQAVRHKPRGTGPHQVRRTQIIQALDRLLAADQVWSSTTLAVALAEEGLSLRPRTVRKYLHLMGARYRRTKACLRHQQDPVQVAQAREELAALKKSPGPANWPSFTWTSAASP